MTDEARFPRTVLTACCVPWDADGALEEDLFRAGVSGLVEKGLRDLYVFGTAGEGYAVDEARFDDVVEVFTDETRQHGVEAMVGVISLSLATVIGRIERCLDRGVSSFQLSLPAWGVLNDAELAAFFAETCGRFPEARFLHYNVARSGRLLAAADYAELAARHPNLVAVKHTRVDFAGVQALSEQAPALRHFFTEAAFSYAATAGPCGFLVSIASVDPRRARAYFDAGVAGDVATLTATCRELLAMGSELRAAVGPGPHMDGAFDKIFSKINDERFPLRLLPPYQGATDEAYERFRDALRDRFPDWVAR